MEIRLQTPQRGTEVAKICRRRGLIKVSSRTKSQMDVSILNDDDEDERMSPRSPAIVTYRWASGRNVVMRTDIQQQKN